MLTSKQRAALRAIATNIDTILQVGKGGVSENLVAQVDDALRAREIIKVRVLETAFMTPAEAAQILSEATGSEVAQVIGTKFVLYRENKDIPKEKRIKL